MNGSVGMGTARHRTVLRCRPLQQQMRNRGCATAAPSPSTDTLQPTNQPTNPPTFFFCSMFFRNASSPVDAVDVRAAACFAALLSLSTSTVTCGRGCA